MPANQGSGVPNNATSLSGTWSSGAAHVVTGLVSIKQAQKSVGFVSTRRGFIQNGMIQFHQGVVSLSLQFDRQTKSDMFHPLLQMRRRVRERGDL